MKLIQEIEKAERAKQLETLGISEKFYWAYNRTIDCDLKFVDFELDLWEADLDSILRDLKRYDQKFFTISSAVGLRILAAIQEKGCKMIGMVKIRADRWSKDLTDAIKFRIEG